MHVDAAKLTEFQKRVFAYVSKIPKGKVTTYEEVARAIGSPKAYRAVGNALRKNPFPGKIPCHRVIRSDGRAGKYLGKDGKKKMRMLAKEGLEFKKGRIRKQEKMQQK